MVISEEFKYLFILGYICWVFCIETYLIEILSPKNVHFDTNIIIIALTEAKILVMYCCKWKQPF